MGTAVACCVVNYCGMLLWTPCAAAERQAGSRLGDCSPHHRLSPLVFVISLGPAWLYCCIVSADPRPAWPSCCSLAAVIAASAGQYTATKRVACALFVVCLMGVGVELAALSRLIGAWLTLRKCYREVSWWCNRTHIHHLSLCSESWVNAIYSSLAASRCS